MKDKCKISHDKHQKSQVIKINTDNILLKEIKTRENVTNQMSIIEVYIY